VTFLSRLKAAMTGDAGTSLVLLGNFEVEDVWAAGESGLPRVAFETGSAVVHRMDEFALLLGGAGDHVVLKAPPDPDYLAYLAGLGVPLPEIHVVAEQDPRHTVTRDALADEALAARLGELAGSGAVLFAHGNSTLEEQLAARAGIPLAGSPAAICKAVNSKVYSRRLADELGLRQPHGWACDTVEQWSAAVDGARELLAAGRPVVVKDAFGVSGKGIVVLNDVRRLDQTHRMLTRRAERSGDERVALVVEEWMAKRADLNYQVTVGRDGSVEFDFVKEAITQDGIHKGHRMPPDLTDAQLAEVREAGGRLGARLAAAGYVGVAGVDAMVGADERLFPVTEINARNNMSTYQVPLQERFVPVGWHALARQYPLRLPAAVPFKQIRRVLGDTVLSRAGSAGLLVNNFATVNAAAPGAQPGESFTGRLYGLVVAPTAQAAQALDDRVAHALARLDERSGS
jgi:phosphoribosylaminoimidazole carboxylase (NCAIR synthetase)